VVRTRVGYSGGRQPAPTYHNIGDHSETVQVDFDPSKIPYQRLLDVYLSSSSIHQAAWSRQYRNAIFYSDKAQFLAARESLAKIPDAHVDLEQLQSFTLAEDYHQKYYLQNSPLMREFAGKFPDKAHFVDSTATARVNGYLMGSGSLADLRANLPHLGLSPAGQDSLLKRFGAPGVHCQ
jgi:peptide methionine sulfoxide reductase MsrA